MALSQSSSHSLSRRGYGLVGGSLRVHSSCSPHPFPLAPEQESLLSHPHLPHHSRHRNHHPPPPAPPPPPLLSRQYGTRRDRRALSPTANLAHGFQDSGRRSGGGGGGSVVGSGGFGTDHRDCNGKTAHTTLITEVYPQVNARKDRADLDEETDYSICFRVQKMMEVYRPDWCESRENWSVYLFSPHNK
uniref:Uncharacterized protein n=1 Tax=Knipowitschia caucasica TaxID=637954 RepID=A0AAV2KHU3_KNICA